MELSSLLKGIDYFEVSGKNENVTSLSCDSRKVKKQSLFFCIPGLKADGHAYAEAAVNKGAAVLVVERFLPLEITQVFVKDVRRAMAIMAGNFYGNPGRKMKLIGVTGTNGKTTTTYIIREILKTAGVKTGLIGTTCNMIGDTRLPSALTTPDPIELHKLFADMLAAGVETVVMEVSAHAVDLRKMDGTVADVAVFTNLSQDHLDYFGTMEKYGGAKRAYFTPKYCKKAVVNIDDPFGQRIAAEAKIPVVTFGCDNPADVFAVNYESAERGLKYVINLFDNVYDIKFNLSGRYNMYNTLCAAAVCHLMGVGVKNIARGIAKTDYIPGRFNILDTQPYTVILDYAHTPDGIENIAATAREFCKGRLVVVFGCGGDRDKSKRALMGAAAGKCADFCILTSDNPRFEDPFEIMRQAERGLIESNCKYLCVENRKEAIAYALKFARKKDVILILGKGDENYQDIMGVKYPYNDADAVYGLTGNSAKAEKAAGK